MDGRGDAPTDRHAANDVGRKAVTSDHGGQDGEKGDDLYRALDRPGEIGEPGGRDAQGQRHVQDGETQGVPGEFDARGSAAARTEYDHEQSAHGECADGRDGQIAQRHPAPRQCRQEQEQRDRSEGAADPEDVDEPADSIRRRAQRVSHDILGMGVGTKDQYRTERRQDRNDQADPVRTPPSPSAVANGGEEDCPPGPSSLLRCRGGVCPGGDVGCHSDLS